MTEVPGWPLPQKVLVYLLHFYLQELLMGISSNMTIFLGFLAWSFILFDMASFFSFFSSFPYTLSSCLFLSPSCLSCYCLIWWWAVVARYRRKKKRLQYETALPMSQESYKWWTKNRLFPENSFLCLQDAAVFFPSCDIYFSFLRTSDLRTAGLRSVVRKTTDLSVILSCLIWKNIGIFSFPASYPWQKFFNYRLTTFIQICMSGF